MQSRDPTTGVNRPGPRRLEPVQSAQPGVQLRDLRRAATVSSARVFDHIGIYFTDFVAADRFYRTVLSVLGSEPSYSDPEMVGWDDWWIGRTDSVHPVTRGLHVGFRAPSREAVDAFWQAGIDAGYRDDGAPGPRTIYRPGLLRRLLA